jgi:hypothetical protein
MSKLDDVTKIITDAGGKSYRRPYTEDDMLALRDRIQDAVTKWAKGGLVGRDWDCGDLSQLDVKRMALHALSLSIFDIEDEGETKEDIDAFKVEVVAELEDLIAMFRNLPRPEKPDNCRGRCCDELRKSAPTSLRLPRGP